MTAKFDLPKFELEPEYKKKVNRLKQGLSKEELTDLAEAFVNLKNEKKLYEESLADVNLRIEAHQQRLLELFDKQDIKSLKLIDGTSVFSKSTAYPQVTDKIKLFKWIEKTKSTHLLSIAHTSLKALVNDLLTNGDDIPPGVDAFLKDSIGYRRGKDEE